MEIESKDSLSERCVGTSMMRREAEAGTSKLEEVCQNLDEEKGGISRPSNEDVAGWEQVASGTTGKGQKGTTNKKIRGDLAFYLYDRQERISDRLNKKIERLGRRIAALEERGRP